MAVTFVGTPTTATSATAVTSVVATAPAGIQEGDYLVAAVRCQSNVASVDVSSASGFARISAPFVAQSSQGRVTGLFMRRVTASEPASYTFTFAGSNNRWAVTIVALRTAGGALTVAGMSSPYEGTTVTNGRGTAEFTATAGGIAFWTGAAEFTPGGAHVPASLPSGYTQISLTSSGAETTTSRTVGWVGYREVAAGTVAAASIAWPAAPSAATAQAVVLHEEPAPEPEPEPDPETVTVGIYNGTAEIAHDVFVWSGTQEQNVQDILALPRQSYTVADMDADIAANREVFWAHRGGSLNWSEMTMRAYTHAVWHGALALEISVCRSADGVYVMSHDTSLNRVTGTNLGAIADVNSSSLLGLPVTVPVTGGVVGRLEDVTDAYSNMLLIVDDKTAVNYAEFLALLKTLVPDATNRVIIKIDGMHHFSRFRNARDAGFKTAAYFYGPTSQAKLEENMPFVDYPGMNSDADVAAWDFLKTFNKPIWGHVLANTTEYNDAKTKGAKIFQCADVKAIVPRVNTV